MRALAGITVALALLAAGCNRAAQQSAPSEVASAALSETAAAEPSEGTEATQAPVSPAPSPATEPTNDPAPQKQPPSGADSVEAWYVRSAARGPFVEPERRQLGAATVGVARAAFTQVITGDPHGPGLSTMAPKGTRVLGVNRKDDLLILDVSKEVRSASTGSAGETAFAQQLAHTATQFPGVRSVRLLVEGEQISQLWGHLDWSAPVKPDEFAISPVVVTKPAHRATIAPGKTTFTGTANTFEATVQLRLIDPSGAVARETFTTATCGSGCRGDWAHTFAVTTPGRWKLVAAESDPSGGEGGGPFTTVRVFVVK